MDMASTTTDGTATDSRSITVNRAYSVPELARALNSGTRPLYRDIRAGRLKAAIVNARGDLRVLGAWALNYLEDRAARGDAA